MNIRNQKEIERNGVLKILYWHLRHAMISGILTMYKLMNKGSIYQIEIERNGDSPPSLCCAVDVCA